MNQLVPPSIPVVRKNRVRCCSQKPKDPFGVLRPEFIHVTMRYGAPRILLILKSDGVFGTHNRSGIAAKISDHQPDRIVFVDGATGGTKRKALARRKSTATLDRNRTPGGGEKVPAYQRLSRTLVAEGTPESFGYSAEGGAETLEVA